MTPDLKAYHVLRFSVTGCVCAGSLLYGLASSITQQQEDLPHCCSALSSGLQRQLLLLAGFTLVDVFALGAMSHVFGVGVVLGLKVSKTLNPKSWRTYPCHVLHFEPLFNVQPDCLLALQGMVQYILCDSTCLILYVQTADTCTEGASHRRRN